MLKINIRWSDIDANRHLANSAYINFMSYARVVEMKKAGVTQKVLEKHNLGPIVFYEKIFYFKEVLPEQPVFIDIKLKGLSADYKFFQFEQNMYDENGQNMAGYEMMGSWIDMKKRKLATLPQELAELFQHIERTEDFKVLTKEDTRKFGMFPKPISPERIKENLQEAYQ